MFAFAREVAAKAPPETRLPLLVTTAHWEMCLAELRSGGKYFVDPAVWEEMRESYGKVLANFPKAVGSGNFLAKAAYLGGDLSPGHGGIGDHRGPVGQGLLVHRRLLQQGESLRSRQGVQTLMA